MNHQAHPCAACGTMHPAHLTINIPETRQALGLEHVPQLIRQLLDLPSPQEAQQRFVPHDPLGRPASHHFSIQVTPIPGQEKHPWAQDSRVFQQTLDEIGLEGLGAFGPDAPDSTHDTTVDGRQARTQVVVLLNRQGQLQLRMLVLNNNTRPTPIANALLQWRDHSSPQGKRLHQQVAEAVRLTQAGGALTLHTARPASDGTDPEPREEMQLHSRIKTAAAVNDPGAMLLLAQLADRIVLPHPDPDSQPHTIPLSKLTAAHLAEIGANSIYITGRGQQLAREAAYRKTRRPRTPTEEADPAPTGTPIPPEALQK